MPADLPIFNGNTKPGEEEQSLDVPAIELFSLNDASGSPIPMLDLSADLPPDLIDIAALVRDEHLLDEQGEIENHPSVEIVTLAKEGLLLDDERLSQQSQLSQLSLVS